MGVYVQISEYAKFWMVVLFPDAISEKYGHTFTLGRLSKTNVWHSTLLQ